MPRPLRRVAAVFLLLAVAALAFALPAAAGGRPFRLTLTGAAERPVLGDPDATGTAHITVNPGKREVCWTASVQGVDLPLVAAHIHEGDSTIAGPPVIFLIHAGETDADGVISGCATVDRSLALALILTPENFYVNLHTNLFQGGAVRAQLG